MKTSGLFERAHENARYVFRSRDDLEKFVSEQPIAFGKHGNPSEDEVVDEIMSDKNFQFGKNQEKVINKVFDLLVDYPQKAAKKASFHSRLSAVIDILEIRVAGKPSWSGQVGAHGMKDTKGDQAGDKDHKRIQDIVTKSNGDGGKILQLVMNMAKSIDKADKARRRGEAALHNLPKDVAQRAAQIFFARADFLDAA